MATEIELSEDPIAALKEHARISIAFDVDRVLEIEVRNHDFVLAERRLDVSYRKDYDEIPGEGPASWGKRFDLSNWGLIAARLAGRRVGGAVVACDADSGRVVGHPRRPGASPARDWLDAVPGRGSVGRNARMPSPQIKVETQNINVAACRLYLRQGCALEGIDRFAYPALPGEIQMIWCKDLE